MLIVVIAIGRLIADSRFNIGMGLMLIYKVGSNTRVVIKDKIVEILIEAKIDNGEKILIEASFNCGKVKNADDITNTANIDKMIILEVLREKFVYCQY